MSKSGGKIQNPLWRFFFNDLLGWPYVCGMPNSSLPLDDIDPLDDERVPFERVTLLFVINDVVASTTIPTHYKIYWDFFLVLATFILF